MLLKGALAAPTTYNAAAIPSTDHIQALTTITQCRFLNSISVRSRNPAVHCVSYPNRAPVLSVETGDLVAGSEKDEEESLADRLRLGSLTEEGLSYKEKFIVRSYEVGVNKTATVETIANLLQEVGCNHAQSVGFSTDGFATTPTMRKLHLIWVTARMHIEIYKYPAWSDVVEIETWCQSEGRIGTRRDWILKDFANGEVIGRATSKWVMMNQDSRRLQKVTDDVRDEYLVFCPKTLRLAFPEENNSSLRKISKLEDPSQYYSLGLVPRRADLDMNQHVNNVTYIGWILESVPQEVIDTHELRSITLDYRRECQRGDVVALDQTPKMASRFVTVSFLLAIPFLAALCNSFSTDYPSDRRILVLLDDFALKSSHSLFFNSLHTRGFDLDYRLADDRNLALQRYGRYSYDALIVFAPHTESFGGSINPAAILDFIDSGHDLILAADVSASDLIREVAVECGVEFDEDPEAVVIDHTSYAVSETEGDHTLIASDNFIQSDVILGSKKIEAPILFQGIGHSSNPANGLVIQALSATPSAYSANPKSELTNPPALTGSAISLISVVQARNNARILISGSLRMFSNRFFKSAVQKAGSTIKHDKSGNEQFLTELSKWVFHERGHLKAVNVRHHKVGEANEPSMYRITDDVEYSVEIYEWSGTSWEPFVANDVQVQFYMMSPYVLKTLSTDHKGVYYTAFKVPDVYGVFQFKVEYQRLGYTSLSLSKQIPVRPFRHDEYERFLTAAFPYYGASFSMMAGFFIFTIAYLYNK